MPGQDCPGSCATKLHTPDRCETCPGQTCSGRELKETASPWGGVESIRENHADDNESEPDSADIQVEPAS